MARKNKPFAEYTHAFMVMEATSYRGGFGNYMNLMMERMQQEMIEAGHLEPFKWRFSGGDGVTVPVRIHCEIT